MTYKKIDPAIDETLKRVALDRIDDNLQKPSTDTTLCTEMSAAIRETMDIAFGAE